jgi:hypothetical protein
MQGLYLSTQRVLAYISYKLASSAALVSPTAGRPRVGDVVVLQDDGSNADCATHAGLQGRLLQDDGSIDRPFQIGLDGSDTVPQQTAWCQESTVAVVAWRAAKKAWQSRQERCGLLASAAQAALACHTRDTDFTSCGARYKANADEITSANPTLLL